MTLTLHFALTFVTLVVLATIVYLRMARYEVYLREQRDGIQRLNERIQALVDGLEQLGARHLETKFGELQEVLEAIRDGQGRPMVATTAPSADVAPQRFSSLLDLVETRLYNLGFSRVHVITELSEVDTSEPVRITVEAEKGGVAHKGHLVIHGSAVTEYEMQASYTSFP